MTLQMNKGHRFSIVIALFQHKIGYKIIYLNSLVSDQTHKSMTYVKAAIYVNTAWCHQLLGMTVVPVQAKLKLA